MRIKFLREPIKNIRGNFAIYKIYSRFPAIAASIFARETIFSHRLMLFDIISEIFLITVIIARL